MEVPTEEGVPEMSPVAVFRVRLAGKEPEDIAQV